MEEKINEKLNEIKRQTVILEHKYNKTIDTQEKARIHHKLEKLDAQFQTYMEVLDMMKEG